ncbi:hypothetical protein L3X38_026934 [Prunus dulcis]|uniref:Uncharacterized protein n=1 Tax=Prunus dulcis TaxID=3755 RepID=A0AAD4VN77_PRUDU|nr:hypothetical protein L3X38_026934 [Prunus dulcis]
MKKTKRVRIMGLSVRENIGFKLESMDRPKRFDLFVGSKWTQDFTTVLNLLNPGFTFPPSPGRSLNNAHPVSCLPSKRALDIYYKAFGKASHFQWRPKHQSKPRQLMESNLFQFPSLHHPVPQVQLSK